MEDAVTNSFVSERKNGFQKKSFKNTNNDHFTNYY